MKKKLLSVMLAATLCFSLTSNVIASESITLYGEPHCDYGTLRSSTVVNTIGSESRTCAHGAVGRSDIRYKYQQVTTYKCSGCDFETTATGRAYWGEWICGK